MRKRSVWKVFAAFTGGVLLAGALMTPAVASGARDSPKPTGVVGTRGLRPDLNGQRIKGVNDPAVYLVLDGKRRWIPNPATYNSLFRDWTGISQVIDINSIDDGGPITDGAVLARAGNAPAVYLVSNGVRRWIVSPAAFDHYWFDWTKIVSVPNVVINSVPVGANIS